MIAPLVHSHHIPYQEDVLFWLNLARQYGGPVLELGCGTGRVMLPLVEAGFKVIGLDHDLGMLRWLQQRFPKTGSYQLLATFQAAMGAFRLNCTFPLIILPCNTLSCLAESERNQVYLRVASHLSLGGAFAFSITNPPLLQKLPQRGDEEVEEEFSHPVSGNPVQVSSEWHKNRKLFTLTWHYDHLLPDGVVERFSLETRHALQDVEAYQQEMAQAGLQVVEAWGDFEGSAYSKEAEYWVCVAKRG